MSASESKQSIGDFSRAELAAWCEEQGQGGYRADQIRRWIFGKRVSEFQEMHDIPAPLREQLENRFAIFTSTVVRHQISKDRTEKLLLQLPDGNFVECVLMRETRRRTVCVSTQVGCAMGCTFCASGMLGLMRNLSAGEIIEQILRVDRLLKPNERITNVVVMGIGEPLANLPALRKTLETLNEKGGMGLGARRMTISTVGLPEKIRELAAIGKPYNLAVSLHAPNDELRNQIVPVNANIGLQSILSAADDYFEKTGRRVTYEYVLLAGTNDSVECARELALLLKGRNAHVNLIPMNDVSELAFQKPSLPQTTRFVETLEYGNINVTVRKRKGADIDAACGQLRLKAEPGKFGPETTPLTLGKPS